MTLLAQFDKDERRAVVKAATRLYKSGAEPNDSPLPEYPTRAQVRQAQRALGHRGSKSAKKNPERHARRLQRGADDLLRVLAVDEALAAAKDRVEHPIKSRLR